MAFFVQILELVWIISQTKMQLDRTKERMNGHLRCVLTNGLMISSGLKEEQNKRIRC